MTLATVSRFPTPHDEPVWDLLEYSSLLDDDERDRLDAARAVFERVVRPVVAEHWENATFPHEILPELGRAGLVGIAARGGSHLLQGLVHAELCRVDVSVDTFLGVHSELFTSAIRRLGSAEQKARWMPRLETLARTGAFALTEPDHGSDISRGLGTTATRVAGGWELTGEKRWIGNATFADGTIVWARDTDTDTIRGFIVERGMPGFEAEAIERKTALRIVQNAHIRLDRVRVPDEDRLPGADGFSSVNALLTDSRVWVAWQTVGVQLAAYDLALAYALECEQFGRPIAGFQLVQQNLVRMLENATSTLGILVRLAQLQDAGRIRPEHAALAKASGSARMRETVAMGRAIFGGNGISTDYGIARVFADAEAVFSYEGSHEINTLVVGRAITGISAF